MGRRRHGEKGNTHFGLAFSRADLYENMLAGIEQGSKIRNEEAALIDPNESTLWVLVSMRRMSFEDQSAVLKWLCGVLHCPSQGDRNTR
ncbi:MAG: hypothetical protein FD153_818 [Rhodospirillaceae bacterium]|nr:MAG: hypothetical protein FD153_818 [Rhodospirillaceae bacterium]